MEPGAALPAPSREDEAALFHVVGLNHHQFLDLLRRDPDGALLPAAEREHLRGGEALGFEEEDLLAGDHHLVFTSIAVPTTWWRSKAVLAFSSLDLDNESLGFRAHDFLIFYPTLNHGVNDVRRMLGEDFWDVEQDVLDEATELIRAWANDVTVWGDPGAKVAATVQRLVTEQRGPDAEVFKAFGRSVVDQARLPVPDGFESAVAEATEKFVRICSDIPEGAKRTDKGARVWVGSPEMVSDKPLPFAAAQYLWIPQEGWTPAGEVFTRANPVGAPRARWGIPTGPQR